MTLPLPPGKTSLLKKGSSSGANKIFGVGEMADLTRAFDWGSTHLGTIEEWPEALLVTVNTLLASRHPMFLWWTDDLFQFYNDGYRASLRDEKHPQALGNKGKDCWPEIWHIIGPQIDDVMTQGTASWHENQLVPIYRNGRLEDVYWTYGYSPVRDGNGKICGTLVVVSETTDNVLARRALHLERERLAALFAQAPAFFAVLDGPNFVFEMTNPPYQKLIGDRDLLGKSVAEAVPEVQSQGFIRLLEIVYKTGKPFIGRSTPIELASSDGQRLEMHYLDFVYQPRLDPDGHVNGIIVLGVDVTESKRAEQALLQSEKLAAVGRLASSIAHEINNPLEAVTNLLFLAKQAASQSTTKQYLAMAEVELQRVAAITNQTLRFHRQSTNRSLASVEQLIDGTLPLYQGRLNNNRVRLERRDRVAHPVKCFDGEIRQVLSNLVGNAIDAMGARGGRLMVRSREATHWPSGRKGIVLTVADTGSGISPTTRARMFEPFFTTKDLGGTGLGLWISQEIINRHRGVLSVRSRQQPHPSCTVFTLFLPFD